MLDNHTPLCAFWTMLTARLFSPLIMMTPKYLVTFTGWFVFQPADNCKSLSCFKNTTLSMKCHKGISKHSVLTQFRPKAMSSLLPSGETGNLGTLMSSPNFQSLDVVVPVLPNTVVVWSP